MIPPATNTLFSSAPPPSTSLFRDKNSNGHGAGLSVLAAYPFQEKT